MTSFQDRVTKLEQRHRPRRPGLSFERRKHLTDRAVAGDQEALQELTCIGRGLRKPAPNSALRPLPPL